MDYIGKAWVSLRGKGLLASVVSMFEMMKHVVIEGRLPEVAVNLGREFVSPYLNPVIDPGKPIYRWQDGHIATDGESPLRLVPLGAQVDGICHAHAEMARLWAWHESSLLALDVTRGTTEEVYRFPRKITTMHCTTRGDLLVALEGSIYLSSDSGVRFSEVLRLSHDWSRVYSRTLAEDGRGRLVMGEYGNGRDNRGRWEPTAWIHWSHDGSTWKSSDFLIRAGVNKHVHVVGISPFSRRLHVTTGDNRKWLWTNHDEEALLGRNGELTGWEITGRAPWKLGGFAAVAFTPYATYWGTDYWMGTNFVAVDSHDGSSIKWMLGSPFRRNPIPAMAALLGENDNYVLAKSANKYDRREGASGLLALNERERNWSVLLMDADDRDILIAQCSADHASSWAHVRLRRRSFMVAG